MSNFECLCGCTATRRFGFHELATEEHRAWKTRQAARIFGVDPLALASRQPGMTTVTNYLTQAARGKAIWDDIATKKGTNVPTNKDHGSYVNRREALERAVDFHDSGIGDATELNVLATADAFYAWLQEEKPAEAPKTPLADAIKVATNATAKVTAGSPSLSAWEYAAARPDHIHDWTCSGDVNVLWNFTVPVPPGSRRESSLRLTSRVRHAKGPITARWRVYTDPFLLTKELRGELGYWDKGVFTTVQASRIAL